MQRYRVTNAVSPSVTDHIQPGYECYHIMTPMGNGISWKAVAPDKRELAEKDWYNQFKYMDPNEINEKMGMPPNYVVLKHGEEPLSKWVRENFDIDSTSKESNNDVVFIGEWKGYANKDK